MEVKEIMALINKKYDKKERLEIEYLEYKRETEQITEGTYEFEYESIQNKYRTDFIDNYEEDQDSDYYYQSELKKIDNEIQKLFREKYLKEQFIEIEKNITSNKDEDLLGLKNISKDVCEYIIKFNQTKPLSIGILGEWGSGKSTTLKYIQEELIGNKEIEVLNFKASHYDDQESIWFELINKIEKNIFKNKNWFKRYFVKCCYFLYKNLNTLFNVFAILLIFFICNYLGELIQGKAFDYIILLGLIPAFLPIVNLIVNLFNYYRKGLYIDEYKKSFGKRDKIYSNVKKIKKIYKIFGMKKMVLCIDELDRCSPDTINNFFKALDVFYEVEDIVFIFSFNHNIIYNALVTTNIKSNEMELKHNDRNVNGKIYIEKYIDLVFFLGNYNYSKLINKIVWDNKYEKEINRIVTILNSYVNLTPRSIIRIMNFIPIFHSMNRDISVEETIYITFIEYYFPGFLKMYFKNEDMIKDLEVPDVLLNEVKYKLRGIKKHNPERILELSKSFYL